jgi:hypothetical protein
MIRKLVAGASLAGLLTLGMGTALRTANAQDPAGKQEQQESKTISGKVASIGNGGHSFSLEVTGENKNTMNFVVDKNTQVNGQVREGTAVTVQYQAMANGQNLAVSITAQA